jgi:Family of unknown function (DUF6262)
MTDLRARRTAVLTAAAKAKSEAKAHAADQAIRRLVKRGEPVTFQAVQREAGVSHAFLYGNPELRERIERLRSQARPKPAPPADGTSDNTIIQALTSQISHLQETAPRPDPGAARRARAGPRREPATAPRARPPRLDRAARNDVTTSHQLQQRSELRKQAIHAREPWITVELSNRHERLPEGEQHCHSRNVPKAWRSCRSGAPSLLPKRGFSYLTSTD